MVYTCCILFGWERIIVVGLEEFCFLLELVDVVLVVILNILLRLLDLVSPLI